MTIRKTTKADLPTVLNIYAGARTFMKEAGNPNQWKNMHPPKEQIEEDINTGESYVCIIGDEILAVFFFSIKPDPTYGYIEGEWLSNAPCGVVHRIARNQSTEKAKGAGAFCLNWCFEQISNIRIDTHKDNAPMINLLKSLGFKHCGTIWLENGEERMAFQKI